MLLVPLSSKVYVASLRYSVALPGDAVLAATQGHTGAGCNHLSEVNFSSLHLNNELVSSLPVVNLVQSKLNSHSVCHHRLRTGSTGDGVGPRHLLTACSQPSEEVR